MSKRVEYDISKSEYSYKYKDLIFFFSSQFNRNRFVLGFNNYVSEETNKLKVKYHVNISLENFLLVAYYKKIEKRGFRVLTYKENDIIELNNNHTFEIS